MKGMRKMSNVLGKKVAKIALTYEGCKTGDKKHKQIVDTFNKEKPNGQVASYKDYWCAIFWTAMQLKAGMTHKDVPMGYNVPQLVEQAKDRGIWIESDKHIPRKGDGIVYDWQDTGKGDNKGTGDHIGTVYKVSDTKIYVIEGNAGDEGVCKKRVVALNGRYIRGFICPKYNAIYLDILARKYAWKKGTAKKKYAWKGGKACKAYRKAWKKLFPDKTLNADCHRYVKLVMKSAGYKTMPLTWSKLIKYLKKRCDVVKFSHKTSQLKKGDIMVYRRIDSDGVKHYHIWMIVEVGGKLRIAEAQHKRAYAHINTNLKKACKKHDKTWLFRVKEVA